MVCSDRACCPRDLADMLSNPKRHGFNERVRQVRELERIPDRDRARHFLDTEMARADQLARQVKELKTGDDGLGPGD